MNLRFSIVSRLISSDSGIWVFPSPQWSLRILTKSKSVRRKRVLLISSSGGHWIQVRRIEKAFTDFDKYYICTDPSYYHYVENEAFFSIPEASRWNKFHLIRQALHILALLLYIRPEIVITTGASSGFFALFFAKKLGIKTIWLDSLANVDKLSLSGTKAGKYADLWLTQWEHLARPEGPHYYGSVL
jgi:UDP-N-acetylglucosamine:LPS N-acetylglucosamine transferase